MFNAKTATSTNSNPAQAGKEAALGVKDVKNLKMAFVYSGAQYSNQAELINAIEQELKVPVIGNTSSVGVITDKGFVTGDNGFAGILAIGDEDMTVGIAGKEKGKCPVETGEEVAREALKNAGRTDAPDYFYMVAPPGQEEYFLKGITKVIGRVPFFGGSAADNDLSGQWKVYTDKVCTGDGVAVAFFYTKKPFANKFTGAYGETANVGVITKLDGDRCLQEIDGIPANKKYQQWTGVSDDAVAGGNLLVTAITAPLGVKDPLGNLVAVRHPMAGNPDGSMNIGNNMAVGTAIMQLDGSVDGLINSTGLTLAIVNENLAAPAGAYHLVHCGGRRIAIGDRINEVYASLKEQAGDTPFITEFTFGEYGYEGNSANTCGGLMLSFTAFGK
ncbi:MAG: FIST N-terminal domain-containing protein [Oscillospiraceae bacterium]